MEIISIACEPLPRTDGRTRGTIEDIRQTVLLRGLAPDISWTTIQRTLAHADLRPHLVQGWVHSPDPLFREKVAEITDLYLNRPANSVVLSVDEKTGMQALQRRFPDRPAAPGRRRRRDYEYKRHGTQSLLCALDVHTGQVVAGCNDTRTGTDLEHFMERIAQLHPTGTVHIIWDNLNIHYDGANARWTRFNERHGNRFVFHYTPKHASWVNQVELFFSILERQCLRHGSFTSTTELRWTALNFASTWNESARPFRWTFKGYPLQSGYCGDRAA